MSIELVLLRHGQSGWNSEDRLSGWTDVDLSPKGLIQAKEAGKILHKKGLKLDVAHTSFLKRSIRTLWTVLDEMDQMWIPIHKTWRLNERHYGALQGVDREVLVQKYGIEAVEGWRKNYHEVPPPLDLDSEHHPKRDRRYAHIPVDTLPLSESLANTWGRVFPYWEGYIMPNLLSHKTVLVVAHGNVLRTIYKHIVKMNDQDISNFFFTNAQPMLLELDENLKTIKTEILD